jgi:peptide/nickel transport system substrate-binding protein
MPSPSRTLLAPVAALALAAGVAACGSDDSGDSEDGAAAIPSEFAPPTEAADGAAKGGELKVLAAGDVDSMDPGTAYYQFTYMITNAGHRSLVNWEPDDVEEPTPDLAEDDPEISDDEQTITYTIREDVRYSPPVDREVVAADVEYALERSLLPGVANGYVPIYFADIVGYEKAAKEAEENPTGGAPDVEGITAVDDRTLEIELDRPSAAVLTQALSLPVSAPVPEDYARRFDAENPSTYGQHVTFTGPYMVENDNTGELTGYTPGKEIKLVRNPNWEPDTDYRPAYLDSVEVQEGFTDTASASRKVLDGEASVNGDFTLPPNVLKQAATDPDQEGQLTLTPSGGNRYISLNTTEPPFDDIDVRKAVIANADRVALRNTRGGELIGPVASHFIPPELPGFEEAGGLEGDPDLDFIATPEGDPELAASYMRKAGFDSGKCEGPECKLTMIGDNAPPAKDTAEVARGQLEELGFDVDLRLVGNTVMYTRFCAVPEQAPDVCPNVGLIKDFNDPAALLDVGFNGEGIDPENNNNFPLLDVPEINRALNELQVVNDPEERAQAWGELDSQIMAEAPAIPWTWDNQVNVQSTDVGGVINKFNANWDLSFTSLEQP